MGAIGLNPAFHPRESHERVHWNGRPNMLSIQDSQLSSCKNLDSQVHMEVKLHESLSDSHHLPLANLANVLCLVATTK